MTSSFSPAELMNVRFVNSFAALVGGHYLRLNADKKG